ncbi:hypothetical protein FXO37_06069 [Capsicum annuum]|nr:hypothetical protein FXO37_06069 [Capsicum annuum]
MDESWINYYGMPVCFGLQEFAIVTDLRCHHPEKPPPRKRSKARKYKEKINELFDIALHGYKASDLLTDFKNKIIPEQYMEQLCLVWFAYLVILAKDVNKAWAFKAESPLQKQVMDYSDEVSHPRMFRWLAAKSNTKINEPDFFNPLNDAVDLGASSGGVVGVGGRHADAATTRDDKNVDAQEKINIFENTPFTEGEGARHPTVLVKRKKKSNQRRNLRSEIKKIAIPPSPKAVEVQRSVKKVDISAQLGTKKKRDLRKAKNAKPGAPDYPRPPFYPQDFQTMTDIHMPIMDLDFCKKLKNRYNQLNGKASAYGMGLDFIVSMFDLDEEEMIKYVRVERPNPYCKS